MDYLFIYLYVFLGGTWQVCFRKKHLWCHEQDPKGKGLCMGLDGVCTKLNHSWLWTGTVPAEHTTGTQLITAGASKTLAVSVNFLELAQSTCFCRTQVMNLALFLPPSSLHSRACSQQDASPWGIPCSARMLPGQTVQRQMGLMEWQMSLLPRNLPQGSNSTATWQSEKYTAGMGHSPGSSSL